MGNKQSRVDSLSYIEEIVYSNTPGYWKTEEDLFETNEKARRIIEVSGTVLDLKDVPIYKTPPSLCSRTELVELDLSSNPLNQNFTEEMSQLVNLKILNVRKCNFNSVPYGLSKIFSLTKLNISRNNIGTSYSELSFLTNLEDLNLSGCRLDSFENLDSLLKLKKLNLSNNCFTESISCIGKLENLINLNMRKCKLLEWNINIHKLVHLESLDISDNSLSSLNTIVDIKSLKVLNVEKNNILGLENIDSLESIEDLKLGLLKWNIIPESLVVLKNLKNLNMEAPLGVLQPIIFKFQNLTEISFHSNFALDGSILMGCTVLKLTEDDFTISSLLPYLSEEMIDNIHFIETANLYPDLSSLKTLRKIDYFFSIPYGSFQVIKENDNWCFIDSNGKEVSIGYEFQSMFHGDLHVGRNGVFIILPRPLINYLQSEEKEEIIEIAEIIIGSADRYYFLDINNYVWKCRNRPNSKITKVPGIKDIIHLMTLNGEGNQVYAIDINGNIQCVENEDFKIIEGENIRRMYGNTKTALCINDEGNMIEIYSIHSQSPKIFKIQELSQIKCGTILVSRPRYALSLDETGKLWYKYVSNSLKKDFQNTRKWEILDIPLIIVNMLFSHGKLVLLTNQGEVIICEAENVFKILRSDNIPTLPIFCNYVREKILKSARK